MSNSKLGKLLIIVTGSMLGVACGAADKPAAAAELSEDDKIFYYVGTQLADSIRSNLGQLELSDAQLAIVARGVQDGIAGTAEQLDPAVYQTKFEAFANGKMQEKMQAEQDASDAYVARMAAEEGAETTASGLVYLELQAGDGEQPLPTSQIRAHYHGTLRDGTVFDSSVDRGQPLEIGLAQVIPCWTEGIAKMKVGGKAKLTCPPAIAYGPRGSGAVPPNAALTFEVELLGIL